jgi:hypothetical protein
VYGLALARKEGVVTILLEFARILAKLKTLKRIICNGDFVEVRPT